MYKDTMLLENYFLDKLTEEFYRSEGETKEQIKKAIEEGRLAVRRILENPLRKDTRDLLKVLNGN